MNQAELALQVLHEAADNELTKRLDLLPELSPGGGDIVMAKFPIVGTFIFDLSSGKIYRAYIISATSPPIVLKVPCPLVPVRPARGYSSEADALRGYFIGMDWTDGRDEDTGLDRNLSAEEVCSLFKRIRAQGVKPLAYLLRAHHEE